MEQKVYPLTISKSGLEGKVAFGMLWWEFVTNKALKSMKVVERKTLYNNKKTISWSQILTADFSYPDIQPVYMFQEISRLCWWKFPSKAAGEAN